MGYRFRPNEDTVTLEFAEGHELYGLEIVTRKQMPIGLFIEAERGDFARALAIFCEQVISWNAEGEDGEPIPATVAGIGSVMSIAQAGEMLDAWKEAIAEPSAPLERNSAAGGHSGRAQSTTRRGR